MIMLKRFKRDPRNLVGPDVASAPLRTVDLSGTKVTFRCPPQTAMIPLFVTPDQVDIDRDLEVEVHNPRNAYLRVFSSGWMLSDRSMLGSPYGSLCMDIVVGRYSESKGKSDSLFILDSFKGWLCDALEASYGRRNREMWADQEHFVNPITCERSFWRYPQTKEEIDVESLSGIAWFTYETYQPGDSPRVAFEVPIGHRHAVSFSFDASAYGGLDYFSPEHNVKQASEALIREIMSTVTIQLSPQAQREFDEIANRTTSEALGDGAG